MTCTKNKNHTDEKKAFLLSVMQDLNDNASPQFPCLCNSNKYLFPPIYINTFIGYLPFPSARLAFKYVL